MFIIVNGINMPFEEDRNLEPIYIDAAVAEGSTSRWLGTIQFQIDEGADILSIPLDVLKQLGIFPRPDSEQITAQMANGTESTEVQMKLSLRIETTNGEVISLHEVPCSCPPTGFCLLGRNVLQVFRKTVAQNKLQELVINPKTRTWLGLLND